jgi:hypothetical protein
LVVQNNTSIINRKSHFFITCGKDLLNEYASLAQGLVNQGSRVQISDGAAILIFEANSMKEFVFEANEVLIN